MDFKRASTVMAAVSMVLLFMAPFSAEAGHFGPFMQKRGIRSGFDGLGAFLELKITDTQRAAITEIIGKYRNQSENLRDGLFKARRHLREVLSAEPFNEEEARKAFREASAAREEMFVLRAKMTAEMKTVLTPEQISLLKARKVRGVDRVKRRSDKGL
jgi:Spy/CpxP family protein refolding chaperone